MTIQFDINTVEKQIQIAYAKGCETTKKEILEFIEKERDNGNCVPDYYSEDENGKEILNGFSASLCLSNLMKYLKDKERNNENNN